jgi:hypothetical protein
MMVTLQRVDVEPPAVGCACRAGGRATIDIDFPDDFRTPVHGASGYV